MKPTTADALRLMIDGTLTHADIEANGIRIDVAKLDQTIERTGKRIKQLEEQLKTDEVWVIWKRKFRGKASLGSRPQLGQILFGELGYKSDSKTKKNKKAQVNEAALEAIDLPFVEKYLQLGKLKKLKSTYLMGVRREVVDGYLRPSFNSHLVKTYRGSCDSPNFQNIPIRDKKIGKLIRRCFIARDGHRLVEMDYGGHEFRIAACFWRDKAMIAYASDPALDIHRDMAAECYAMDREQVTGTVRFFAKNQFVFPILYGSYFVNTARNLWSVIDAAELKTKDGIPLKEHLAEQGIKRKDFEKHVEGVEDRFCERFPEWAERKEQWWDRYVKRGWFPLMTGFQCSGVYSRNQLMNTPVQGPAYHCLLWSLIRLNRWLKREKMRSVIVGQIHDSIIADVHESEFDYYVAKAKQVMIDDVRKHWPWILCPLEVEVEAAPLGGSWFDKEKLE